MSYQKLRQKVLERDNYTCQICFKQFDKNTKLTELDAHHIISRRKNGLDSIHNLTSVCESCHGLIETKPKLLPIKYKLVKVKLDTYNRLVKRGQKNETYEDIIRRLLDLTETKNKK